MPRLTHTILITLLAFPLALSAAAPALLPGEELTYRAEWGVLSGPLSAAEIKIGAKALPSENGAPRFSITTTTTTTGPAGWIYKATIRGESIFDQRTGQLLRVIETSKVPGKETALTVTFDYAKSTARLENKVEPAKGGELALPAGEPLDLIMGLVQTRSWNLKPGEKRDSLVIFDGVFYELTIYAEKYEVIEVNGKNVNTLVLVPKMEKTAPKGMFKRGSTVKVWISQDERRLPVKFQTEMKIGVVAATLTKHTPAPAAPAK